MSLAIEPESKIATSKNVAEFLQVLHPDEAFEIRVISSSGIAAGWFTDHAAAAREVAKWSRKKPKGIYVTLNAIRRDMVVSQAITATKNAVTEDDIVQRRWMVIDVDPVRPKDKDGKAITCSASDQERDRAIEVAENVQHWLADRGWPEPLRMMSGNGSYLLYRVELPNSSKATELLRRCIRAISEEHPTDEANIDTQVFDAPRIIKVAGTWARKGRSIDERPHRQAYFHVPTYPIEVVAREAIEGIAELSEPEAALTPADTNLGDLSPERIERRKERCEKYLAKMKPAISGERGHDKFLEAACTIGRFGLNEKHGLDLLFNYNDECDPPFKDHEVARKLTEGLKKVIAKGQFGKFVKGDEKADADPKPEPIQPISFGDLIGKHPTLRKPVIHGLLRKGETANIIASTKAGKSFLAGGLAWSIAAGVPWLGHDVDPGRVAIIDNELHPETLGYRLQQIASEMSIDANRLRGMIDVYSIRGKAIDIHNLDHALVAIQSGNYQLVILDALYRTLPSGTSENDNAAMMAIYNKLDRYAAQWDCSIAVVHHSSKGNQSDKSVTDVGSGAGAISRAADTHLTIRPHSDPELSVLECVTRSFKSPEPKSVRYEFPVWTKVDAEPVLQARKTAADTKQAARDAEADEKVLGVLSEASDWLSVSKIRKQVGFGDPRVERALVRLADIVEKDVVPHPRNSKDTVEVFRLASQGVD